MFLEMLAIVFFFLQNASVYNKYMKFKHITSVRVFEWTVHYRRPDYSCIINSTQLNKYPYKLNFLPLYITTQSEILMTLERKPFKNIVRKGNQHFILFLQYF